LRIRHGNKVGLMESAYIKKLSREAFNAQERLKRGLGALF